MLEFDINGHVYKTSKMDVMVQWAVVRRLAPVITNVMDPKLLKQAMELMPRAPIADDATNALAERPVVNIDKFLDLIAGVIQPFMTALATMSDEDSQFVIDHCLACAHRQQKGGGWAVVKPQGTGLMFQDIDMLEMMQIVVRVILDTVGNFSYASLSSLLPKDKTINQ